MLMQTVIVGNTATLKVDVLAESDGDFIEALKEWQSQPRKLHGQLNRCTGVVTDMQLHPSMHKPQ